MPDDFRSTLNVVAVNLASLTVTRSFVDVGAADKGTGKVELQSGPSDESLFVRWSTLRVTLQNSEAGDLFTFESVYRLVFTTTLADFEEEDSDQYDAILDEHTRWVADPYHRQLLAQSMHSVGLPTFTLPLIASQES